MFCTKCGKQMPDDVKFCTSCGNPMINVGGQPTDKAPQRSGGPVYGMYTQPPLKKSKGPIIAVLSVIVLLIIGVVVYIVIGGMSDQNSQGTSALGGTSVSSNPAASSPESASDTVNMLREYFRNNLVTSYEEADKDYYMDYSGMYDEFRSAEVKGGIVSATYADVDNDGSNEMLVVFWDFDKYSGTGYTVVGVFKVVDGQVIRMDNKDIRSVSYGGTNYTAQAAFKRTDSGTYIYLTSMFEYNTHEGGFFEPTVKVYEIKEGRISLLCDTTASFGNSYMPQEYIRSISLAKEYMPGVVSKFYSIVNENNYYNLQDQRSSLPFYTDLAENDPDIRMLAVNYFMKTRNAFTEERFGGNYYGYWETYTGNETRKEYQGVEHEVLTVPTGTTAAKSRYYILEDSNRRLITESDLKDLSLKELRIARNEIYARHGRKFKDRELQEYFNSMPWYRGTIEPDRFNDNSLSDIEKKNRELIQGYENKLGG